ncbi:hypothetical protein OSTOST_17131, partial [Ostertagia ostertagi]
GGDFVANLFEDFSEQQRGTSTFPTCSTDPSSYDTDRLTEFQIKKEVDTFAYNFDSYTFSEFCDDENKFLKRRGPRTTIKQNQVWFQNRRSKERRLKHLCNYLRHYEQRGLLPPPIQFTTGEGQFDEDDEEDLSAVRRHNCARMLPGRLE